MRVDGIYSFLTDHKEGRGAVLRVERKNRTAEDLKALALSSGHGWIISCMSDFKNSLRLIFLT